MHFVQYIMVIEGYMRFPMKYQKALAMFLAVLLLAGSQGDPIHNVTVYAKENKKAEENNAMDITAQSAVLIENLI